MNKNVLLLSLCQALLVTGNILLVAVSALIGERLAPSPEVITLPVALQFIGLMIATMPASMIMAHTGRKRGFLLGNLVGVGGTVLCMFALYSANFLLYCFGTFLIGIGIGFGNLYRFAALEVCEDSKKSQAISLTMAGGVIAAVLGPNLAVYSQRFMPEPPFFAAFVALAFLYVIALLLINLIHIPETESHDEVEKGRSLWIISQQPVFILAAASGAIGYAVMVLVMTSTPLAMAGCGFNFDEAAWVIEWHVLGMFVPSFFTGRLIQRWGVVPIITTGALLNLLCIIINVHGQTYEHFMAALFLLGVGWNFMFIAATQMVTESYTPQEKAKTQGLNEFIVFGAVTVCALASGWMETTFGWVWLNISMLPAIVVSLLLVGWYQIKRQDLAKT